MKPIKLKPLSLGKPAPRPLPKPKPKEPPKPVKKSIPKPVAKKPAPKPVKKTLKPVKRLPPPHVSGKPNSGDKANSLKSRLKKIPKPLGHSPLVIKLANLADKQGMWARDVIKYKAMLLKAGITPKDVNPALAGLADRYNREQFQKLLERTGANRRLSESWKEFR